MLGRVFALCNADEQAAFLNEAGKNMRRVCGDDNHLENQLCYVCDRLDGAGRDFIKRLAAFIHCDEETPRVVKRTVYEDVSAIGDLERAQRERDELRAELEALKGRQEG